MKNNVDVFKLPELVAEKKLTVKEALNLIGEEITREPQKFGITADSKEFISDLYFSIIQQGHFLFDHYRKEYCSFKTYLYSFIHYQLKTLKRENYKNYNKRKIYEAVQQIEYETQREKYEKHEFDYKIMHFKPYSLNEKDRAPYALKTTSNIEKEFSKLKTSEGKNEILTNFINSRESDKKLTLVIALKSCYYLTEDNISSIAKFCKLDRETLQETIDYLKSGLGQKQEKFEQIARRRDFSFYQHRKYFEKIQNLKDDNQKDEEIDKLYKFHTERWINKNTFLQKESYKVCPSNKVIADLLGICERQVGYYIKNADNLLKIPESEIEK